MRKPMLLVGAAALALGACGGETATDTATDTNAATEDLGPPPPPEDAPPDTGDALVEGTEYNATTILDCGFDGAAPTQSCNAGVIRNWGEDGSHLVEVEKPDGFKRALFFTGTTPISADSAEADGSAGWDFETSREGDRVTITFGPETYVIVDALIEGG